MNSAVHRVIQMARSGRSPTYWALLLGCGLGVLSACSSSDPVMISRDVDAGIVDRGRLDSGIPDLGVLDTSPVDIGPKPQECPCTFVEEFTDGTRIDPAGTTAMLDPSGGGSLSAAAGFTLDSPGTGSLGGLVVNTQQTLSSGTYDYSSITMQGGTLNIAGDAILRVTGTVNISAGSRIIVTGKLDLIAGGNITFDCSELLSIGDLKIQQSAGNLALSCGTVGQTSSVHTDARPIGAGNSGAIQIWTRGGVTIGMGANLSTGSVLDPVGRSGNLEIRSAGDVVVGPGKPLVITGGSAGANGELSLFSEGQLTVDDGRVAGGDSSSANTVGGSVSVRTLGPVTLKNAANLFASPGGSVEVISEQSLSLTGKSYILNPPGNTQTTGTKIQLRIRSLRVGSSQIPGDQSSIIAQSGLRSAARLSIESIEDIQVREQATLGTTNVACIAGGDVTLTTEQGLVVDPAGWIKAGDSLGTASCPAGRGGSLTVIAGGPITNPASRVHSGAGSPAGAERVAGAVLVRLGVLTAELVPLRQATSLGLPIVGTPTMPMVNTSALGPLLPSGYSGVHLLLSVNGTDYLPTRYLPMALRAGWQYRVLLEPRMFDPVRLDRFSIDYR